MARVPSGYPMESDDETLRQTMRSLAATIENGTLNDVMLFSPYIKLGQNELTARTMAATARETERMAKDTADTAQEMKRSWARAGAFSVVAISLAALSLIATALFGFFDWQGDKTWQRDQLSTLRSIERRSTADEDATRVAIEALTDVLAHLRLALERR